MVHGSACMAGRGRLRAAQPYVRTRGATDMMWLAQLLLLVGSAADDAFVVHVEIEGQRTAGIIPADFVSMGWEVDRMIDLLPQLNDSRLQRVASHLSPAVLRVGGISADWVRYTNATADPRSAGGEGGERRRQPQSELAGLAPYWPKSQRNLSLPMLRQLTSFVAAANLSLLFDLDELHGRDCHTARPGCNATAIGWHPPCNVWCTGEWDTRNVQTFLQELHDQQLVGGASPLYAFEVGNELITHESAVNTTADITKLAGIIQTIWSDVPFEQRPGLYAPSAGQASCVDPAQLEIMASLSSIPGVVGFSFHSYPARVGVIPDSLGRYLLNTSWLREGIIDNSDASGCITAWNASGGPRSKGLSLLLTEASASCSGTLPPPAQDSFLHSFFTVAELGQYAERGVTMVARWSFNSPNPTSTISFNPSADNWDVAADYWIMLAHKATIGPGVLRLKLVSSPTSPALVYASCTPYDNGSVTRKYTSNHSWLDQSSAAWINPWMLRFELTPVSI